MKGQERGRHHEIARRYAWHERTRSRRYLPSPVGLPFQRVAELERLCDDQYPAGIPNTPHANKIIAAVAEHLVIQSGSADPVKRVLGWIGAKVRWMSVEQAQMVAKTALNPDLRINVGRTPNGGLRMADADALSKVVGLDMETRTRLKITSIGAFDCLRGERKQLAKIKHRDREAERRRARGQIPREEYEAKSMSRTRPWATLGISRATWYRARGNAPAV